MKTHRVYGAIRAAPAARRVVKSPRLIEAAGQPDSEADQAPAFFVARAGRAALVAEGAPRPSVPMRFQKESI
nr:hypothetical protein [Bacillus velezensis]MDH3104089.1 hypothetical protein [Bacillus velezensis]MDH3139007.1 hypothetical protein [Bacillus velezensis]